MIKNFLLQKMLKKQLQDVPKDQQDQILSLLENNPELFQKIAIEAQAKIKEGKDQMTAMMEVMQVHRDEIQKAMGN